MSIFEIKKNIDTYLEEYFKDKGTYNKLIYESMAYSVNIGGKRIRPILLLLTYEMYQKDVYRMLPMAAAIEMIHTYSLIHDDLPSMDNDDLRRGKPTNHKVFGEAMAILAGDGLLNEAMNIMINFSIDNGIGALKASKIISEAASADGMIGGQVVDILNEGKNIDEDELRYMHLKKTGEIIKASILAGAVLGGAPEEHINLLSEFGEKLGLAFQIKDDILDVIGSTEKLGKNIKSDIYNNKTNFVTVYGVGKCKQLCEDLTDRCIEILNLLSLNSINLRKITIELLNREF